MINSLACAKKCLEKAFKSFAPPKGGTVSEWAERVRILSAESSAETGHWRNSRTPYLVEPMDAFNDPKVNHIVIWAASQVGKSEAELNIIGYIIDEDPGSILYIHPTNVDAKEFSKLRIAPMIRDCPALKAKVADPRQRDSANTITQKTYPGGILTLCGSTEAHALASKPIRYVLGDERDRWASSAGDEGDPWELAMARQTTFYNAKAVEVSTPTIKGASAIEFAYTNGTREVWESQCPACKEYHEIQWKDIHFEYDTFNAGGREGYKVTNIKYVCPTCGTISTEVEMKSAPAHWKAQSPEAYNTGCRSFKLNAFVSQWMPWEKIILKFLQARNDPAKLQVVFNTCFGELWENRGNLENEEGMLARREEYKAELPDGVLVLTAGVDVQDDRLEFEIVGHGRFGETWGIKKGVIIGRPDDSETWEALDAELFREYHYADEAVNTVSMAFVDEGGHFTMEVRTQCRLRMNKNMFCIKGIGGNGKPFISQPKKMNILVRGKVVGNCWQYQLGVDAGKQIIMDNLRVQSPGAKFCHFPRRDDYGERYFNGLLSERLTYKEGRKNPWVWEIIPGHERNENLDIRNYALAAFKARAFDLDAIEAELRERHLKGAKAINSTKERPVLKPTRKASINTSKVYESW